MTLIDTSSWIEFLRARSSAASQRVFNLLQSGEAAICEMILLELWSGVRLGREKVDLEQLESTVPSVRITTGVWKLAKTLAFSCKQNGLTVPATDVLIVSCGIFYRLPIETTDYHFPAIMGVANKENLFS